ncbi:YihY/virulence factor BrkB family protein, partial [Corallococcus coralloides]|nr:YihY/virulence factor BrkB family protein [Corallococcus coralloides]
AWGLALGTLGALLSASNGVAAFHRAMHRVYDTREGRPFLWFRTIVFGETVLIIAVVLLCIGMLTVGGEASQRLGGLIGVPQIAFDTWNVVKWPILLFILIIGVSMAYYLFPNVKLPRYRLITLGSTMTVLVLFGSALTLGQLMVYA